MKNKIHYLLYILFFLNTFISSARKGIVCVPVADLIGQQIQSLFPNQTPETAYSSLAVCNMNNNSRLGCPRLHQLLYNDIVEILHSTEHELCIRICNAYYCTSSNTQPQTSYWTLKKNIILFDDCIQNNISPDHIPPSLNFLENNLLNSEQNIITLAEPHYDRQLRYTFSAGTRFIKIPQKNEKKRNPFKVWAIDYKTMKEYCINLPRHKCIIYNETKNKNERIKDFVSLLKKWSQTNKGFIPYVWGGTSYTYTLHNSFKEVTKTTDNGDYIYYKYEKDCYSPKSGFDCSGAILRAAQMCNIPYFLKNTTTIAQCLKPLRKDQDISEGDLILIKGHVMIVSDISKNLLIEARSYGHGYGKLHEISLAHVFSGITSYNDLLDSFYNKKSIKRIDKEGKIRDTFNSIQLFPIKDIWDDFQSHLSEPV